MIQWHCKKLCGKLTTQKEPSDFTQVNARNARSILNDYTVEQRQSNTMAAAKLHLWVSFMEAYYSHTNIFKFKFRL